jgi:hypothetical protein
VGVGRGRFDEHKGDVGECATSLVFAFVREQVQLDSITEQALQRIVDWVLLEDTGRLAKIDQRDFTVPSILKGEYTRSKSDSHQVLRLGFEILDALLPAQVNQVHLLQEWGKRQEFGSRFGPAVALASELSGLDSFAYQHGFPLMVQVNAANRYVGIRADAASDIDLTEVYEAVQAADPEADWYFHHSKKMVLCGGDLSPEVTPSKLTLGELVELLK